MQVDVRNLLPSPSPDIEREFVSVDFVRLREFLRRQDQHTRDMFGFLRHVRDGFQERLRDEQNMRRGFRMNVPKGKDVLIFKDDGRGDLFS